MGQHVRQRHNVNFNQLDKIRKRKTEIFGDLPRLVDLVEVRNLVPDSTDKPLIVARNRRSIRQNVRLEHIFVLNLFDKFV